MKHPTPPPWVLALEEEDLYFVRRFILASGSLKALAQTYGVSYPTVRSRLDRLIAKVEALEEASDGDPMQQLVRQLVAGGELNRDLARRLLRAHRESLETEEHT
ncbi:MAG: DUF2089 family protein [Candidatus Hydrogenedentes bacterium]|nr:DUF2089 family protein [Candidatus Hydrogenedentota bacterium]